MTAAIDRLADEAREADRLRWPVVSRAVQSGRGLLFRVVDRPLGPSARQPAVSFFTSAIRELERNLICRDNGTGAKETCGDDVDMGGAMARNPCWILSHDG